MTDQELLQALNRTVYPGDIRCLGCGYEHNCNRNGCRINEAAAKRIEELLEDRKQLMEAMG